MKGLWCLLVCLMLAGFETAVAQDSAAQASADAVPSYKIPSDEDITSNEGIAAYREQYRPQQYVPESAAWIGVDIGMLAGILLLGCVMVWRHVNTRHFWLPAVLSLLYFGFIRGGCICPVGSVANLAIGLRHPEMVGMSTGVMFLLPLTVALFMGRVFCVAGCPLGVLQHLLGGRRSLRIPALPHAILRTLPLLALAATAWLALRGSCFLVCLLDPYKTAFFFGYGWIQRAIHWLHGGLVEPGVLRVGDLTAWGIFAAAVLLGRWVYRPFCRFVCPYGVLLGLLSMVAFKRRRIEQDPCVQCGICAKNCPVDAIIRDPQTKEFSISSYHCIQCNGCSSLCRKGGIH
ncbi:MAG: 4Fe-4S binding protein [Verrucomicrobiota bacterium]